LPCQLFFVTLLANTFLYLLHLDVLNKCDLSNLKCLKHYNRNICRYICFLHFLHTIHIYLCLVQVGVDCKYDLLNSQHLMLCNRNFYNKIQPFCLFFNFAYSKRFSASPFSVCYVVFQHNRQLVYTRHSIAPYF